MPKCPVLDKPKVVLLDERLARNAIKVFRKFD